MPQFASSGQIGEMLPGTFWVSPGRRKAPTGPQKLEMKVWDRVRVWQVELWPPVSLTTDIAIHTQPVHRVLCNVSE